MGSNMSTFTNWKLTCAIAAFAVLCALALLPKGAAQSKQAIPPRQNAFATPQDAVRALVDATQTYDVPALLGILGSDAKDLVSSEDSVSDKRRATECAALAREKQSIESEGDSAVRATLTVGSDEWPFPIPLVQHNGQWYFDT